MSRMSLKGNVKTLKISGPPRNYLLIQYFLCATSVGLRVARRIVEPRGVPGRGRVEADARRPQRWRRTAELTELLHACTLMRQVGPSVEFEFSSVRLMPMET